MKIFSAKFSFTRLSVLVISLALMAGGAGCAVHVPSHHSHRSASGPVMYKNAPGHKQQSAKSGRDRFGPGQHHARQAPQKQDNAPKRPQSQNWRR